MSYIPNKAEAKELLAKYNQEPFHIRHGEVVSGVLGYFAKEYDPSRVEFWEVIGMLHDLDFEEFPEEHCLKEEALLKELDVDEEMIRAICSHGWGCTGVSYKPETMMEKILFATDELTGLIGACALMRPSKSVDDMELKSIKKKFKDKSFAAGCSRDVIVQGAEMLGWEVDELLQRTLDAMKSLNPEMGV
ncbi:MAG: hydrolase [Clostridia bacterium]|nr:hydrolase [Clostridia bacterium]